MKIIFKTIILYFLTLNCFSQAGTFDTTFDTDGIQTFCQATVFDFAPIDAGIQSTGKIIQYCYSNNSHISNLIRYNTDGSIDTGFGSNGILSYPYNSLFQGMSGIYAICIQSDDKILLTGTSGVTDFVARLLPNGTLDPSFNGLGYMTFSFNSTSGFVYKIITQTDGKILVCGNPVAQTGSLPFLSVARITTSGVLDSTFGSGGIVLTSFNISPGNNIILGMVVQSDSKLLVGGSKKNITQQANDFALVRFNSNGAVDSTFGTNGIVTTSVSNPSQFGITKLLVQPDGKIVAGGLSSRMTMVRYLTNGSLDPSFGTNGVVFEDGFSSSSCDVILQPDGKLLMAGGSGGSDLFKIFRYTAAGVLDTTFANNANVFPVTGSLASTVLLQNDLKIIVCGDTYTSDFSHLCAVVIRLNNDILGNEGFAKSELSVSPNPVQNVLSVSNESAVQYELFTILGATIQAGSLAIHGQVDCSSMAKGMYLLKLNRDNGESKVVKVVKE